MNCNICKRLLDDPSDRTTKNCGGDCLRCMADCGDEQCQQEMDEIMSSPMPFDDKPIGVGNGQSWFPST